MAAEIGFGPLERIDGPLPVQPVYGLLQAVAAPAAGVRVVVDVGDEVVDLTDLSSTDETMDEAIARLKREGTLPATAGDYRWLNGVEVYPYPPGQPSLYEPCNSNADTAGPGQKDFGSELEHPMFSAMTVYLAETCTSSRVWNQDAFKARAVSSFTAVQSAGLGRQLLAGEGDPMSPHLSDANSGCVFPNDDTPTSALNALALLEEEIGLSGQLGLIHCSPGFVPALAGRFQIDNKTGVLRTFTGNVVIPDAGYARSPANAGYGSPHEHAESTGTQEWIYATGPIDIRLSEIFVLPENVSEALDRGTPDSATTGRPNSITYRVERYMLATWDTQLQVAVLADRCQPGCSP